MLPDRVSNPGPLTYESGALPIALRGPAPDGPALGENICLMEANSFRWQLASDKKGAQR